MVNTRRSPIVAIAVAFLCASVSRAQSTYYVNGECGNPEWSGLSEVCAPPHGPKKAIWQAPAHAGDTVVVAPGVYTLDENAFAMVAPITVRSSGGPFVTVLDGEYGDDNLVFYNFDGGPGVLQGFTLTRVDTFHLGPIWLGEADLQLIDCRFIDNQGALSGVVWMDAGGKDTVTAVDCIFQGNRGSVACMFAGQVEALGCTFIENTSFGGGYSVVGSENVTVANSIFRGEAPFINGDGPVTYCNVEGGYPGEGNIDADPMFVDAAAGDLRLLPGSLCIDAGDNAAVPEWLRLDIGGLERFVDDPATKDTGMGQAPIVDMGAHEFQAVCYADFNGDELLDLFDFLDYVNAFNAGDSEADCDQGGGMDLFDFLCFVNAFNAGC
jgi:hypothetical protein